MEEGLRFRGSGEGDLAPTRYEWGRAGGGGLGGEGNHVLRTHLFEM